MSEQLQLPYAVIEKVAGRTFIRQNKEIFEQTARATYRMPLNRISERPGFNSRTLYEDIEQLADDLYFRPETVDPMRLDITPDGFGLVDEGHRRIRAYWLNLKLGRIKEDHLVEFYANKAEVTELDRMIRQGTSNRNFKKELKPYDYAKVVWNVKNLFSEKPKSDDEVGKLLGISRPSVNNYIHIAQASDQLRQEMITADMNITECLALIKTKKEGDEIADKAEEQSHVTSTTIAPQKDELAGDIKELEELQKETPEEAERRIEKEREELLKVADEVKVVKLKQHKGKKLAMDAIKVTPTDFVDEDSGDVVTIDHTSVIYKKNTVLDEDIIENLQNEGVKTVYLYKPGCEPVTPSVVTVAPEKKEKEKYDTKRPEIKFCNKAIQCMDKIESIVSKLDVPDDVKKDLAYNVHWGVQNMQEVREWVHTNEPR